MARFRNFHMWRGRLPHWRADDVRYYVTFRHRRELTESERRLLLVRLLRPEGRKWNVHIVCVMPEDTHLMFSVLPGRDGAPVELSDVIEPAKRKAGSQIIKATGERFPPFYGESFDRIVRDDQEFEERWLDILAMPETLEEVEDAEDYFGLWVGVQPSEP